MRILHVLQSNRFSGAENVACQIIGMMKNEPNVEMIYCSRDGQIREALAERNISFSAIKDLTVSEVKRVINQLKPDIIHAHDMRASVISSLACGKIPLISHVHNNNIDSRVISPKTIAYLYAGFKAKHIFWVSKSSCEGYVFHKLIRKKGSILYNIIDVDLLHKKMKTDEKIYNYDVIYVGRLATQKNPQRMMQVFGKIAERLPNVKIAVIGSGDLEEEIKILCNELKLNDNIVFLGFQSNPLKMLHDSKVMIMTSRCEGTPMCALEAMALGVPIVSTPTDGLKDIIDEGENGYLSEDNDVLVQKIYNILFDPTLYKVLSENSKSKSLRINAVEPYRNAILQTYNN